MNDFNERIANLPAAERPLTDRDAAASNYACDLCVHQLFEAQVQRTPDATSLVFEGRQLSYTELNEKANRLAHHLIALGVGPDVVVGICVERSLEMIFGLLGILKAGGAYLPLDPDNPKERRYFMLEDASASILITTRSLASAWPECSVQRILLDQPHAMATYPPTNPDSKTTADNLAYIMYTSGSTGKPKGVMIPQRGVTRLVTNTNYADFHAAQTFLQFAPIAFDVSTFEIWGALLNGARLVIFPPEWSSLDELARVIARDNITTLWLTAGLFHLMVDQHLEALTGLRQLLAGGDVLSVSHVRKFLAAASECRLINGYGPTENTTFTCCYTIPRDKDILSSVPIGRPIGDTQVYILDHDLNPVANGVPGELYAGGAGLARGYLNRPELTAEKFIANPFGAGRLYNTGDLARYLSDGNIEFLGRMDHQVKIRGFRIELGEIESVLNEHPAVKACAVITRDDQPNDKRLIAYVVAADPPPVASGVLREFLRQKLPDYMLPSAFIGLDKLPLTPNGKLDRKALPALDQTRPDIGDTFVAPRTALEALLASIYSEVLRIEPIGVHDNFLGLGGHSLSAAQIVARVREALQMELPVRLLLEGSSVSALAAKLDASEPKKYSPLVRVARHGDLPVSFSQERAWFIQQLDPASIAYHFQATLRFTGQLDCAALERSLTEIVRRHEILRTSFPEVNGRAIQVIHDAEAVSVPVSDLQTLPQGERKAAAQRIIDTEIRKRFDLARLPLIRWVLIRLAAHEHVLLQIEHHLIHDGWSYHVFLGELLELYKALTAGKPSPLPDLPIQFADFAIAQRCWMGGEEAAGQLEYWKTKLSGANAVSWLGDRPRPAQQTFVGAAPRIELSLELCESLRALGRRAGVTLFMTMFTAFLAVLQRYTAQNDICVGSGIANRRWRETESMLGMVINNVVLRVDLSGDPHFRRLLRRVQQVTLDAYANQDVPFDQVVRALEQTRDASRNPLFQVMFSFHDSPLCNLAFPKLKTSVLCPLSNGSAKFDLNVIVIPRAEQRAGRTSEGRDAGITLVWEYNSDLFDDATMRRSIGHYQNVLQGIVADQTMRISELPLISPSERTELIKDWNANSTAYPDHHAVAELFEEQVARNPDAVALIFEGAQLSYRELNEQANRLAHHLIARGVGPEVLVALCLNRSSELIVALLAILKAGGAYLALDPDYPKERLSFMLEDGRVFIVITTSALSPALPELSAERVLLDQPSSFEAYPSANPVPRAGPDNLAYVIYTSGSTGRPKGVCVPHRAIVRLVRNTDYIEIDNNDRIAQASNASFDAATFEIWGALLNGAQLIGVSKDVVLSPGEFAEQIGTDRITTLFLTTALFNLMARESPEAFAGVRDLLFGGEQVDPRSVRRLLDAGPPQRLLHVYGPTETTTFSTWYQVTRVAEDAATIPIGRPIANTQIYLLDPHLNPVPIGVPGELHIGGAGLARGYLNRPDLTKEKFIPNPFSQEPGARLYKTGDLARYLPDGNIEFLGRLDTQVKIRGFRIELGEIEAAIARHPAIREAVVLAREDVAGDKRLVAYLVAENPPADLVEQLRALLRGSLPEYMMPAAFVSLDALPLTPNGKVDRKALPAPDQAAYAARSYEAPVGEIETTLAQIWAEVLKLEQVGRHDHFFELGGHSLLAVGLIERMRRAGLHADVRALFVTPTVAALAAAVGGDSDIVEVPPNRIPPGCEAITPEMLPLVQLSPEEIERVVAAVPGGAANVQDIYPLAPLQEGILFHHLMASKGDPYLLSALIGFDSRARLEGYLQALRAVIERHDILRTAVLWEGLPEAVQVVWRQAPLLVEKVSLEPAAGDVAQQLAARFDPRHYWLDVRQAPLLRVFVAHDAANVRWVLLQLFHHLSIDHTTLEVVQQEIQAHLLGQAGQLPTPLPFRNFVAQARLGVSREEHETFFRKMLGDVDEPTAPFGLSDVQGDGSGIAEARRPVDGSLARRLRERARALGVSAASVCHLAWAQVLSRVSGRDDVVFGTVLFGRMQGGEGAERVLGLFINTLPVRIRVGDESVQERVRHTHTLLAQLLRHEHALLALAQRCSAVPPPAPLFSALLNYRHRAPAAQAPTAKALQAWERVEFLKGEERTNYPFVLSVDDLGEGFALTAQVQSPMDPARICTYMHSALEQLVGALESAPATSVRSLDVLPEPERQQLLIDWNQTATDYPKDRCIHQLFEAQADETPDAPAVVFEDKQLSYAELNARANQLAHHLIALGVSPEVLVALCVERSLEMIVALLGILKAGGAYLPLDPAYPKERLAFMLEDARVAVLVTSSKLAEDLPETSVKHVLVDDEQDSRDPETNPKPSVGADNLAYVIYTSGSTGTPKGVTIPHRGVIRLVKNTNYADFNSTDIFLQFAPLSFDASTFEIWGALLNGATLVIMPSHRAALEDLADTLIRERVTTLWLTASLFHLMVDQHLDALMQLRQLLAGGDVLSVAHVTKFLAAAPTCRLINGYGPTENTTFTCCYSIPHDASIVASVPIGRPIANTQVYMLDPHLNPVPIGVPGELCIGGAGLARGYLNRPELTAENFIANPFGAGRLYKTGDLARYLADGNIEFLGRIDTQVKIRGFRTELGEIEAVLNRHPAVKACAVIAREDAPGDKRLVAYVVVAEESAPADAMLRDYLKESLPDYMLPSAFVVLDQLPLTPNGKLDRKALPAPEYRSDASFVAPCTPNEQTLAAIWSEVLKLENIGIHDNFFELGGHSLLATQAISRIRQAFTVDLPLRALFEAPTIAALSAEVARKEKIEHGLAPIPRRSSTDSAPLSFAQQRLWFLDELEPTSTAYHMPVMLRLRGALNVSALRASFSEIVRRHEVLRTTFATAGNEPVQVIHPPQEFNVSVIDLTHLASHAREAEAMRLASDEAKRPFDLSSGPLFRARLIKLDDHQHLLALAMHHIVSDGWSMSILSRELSALYRACIDGTPSPLAELPIQYADYAVWQRGWFAERELQQQLSYWKKQLEGAPALSEFLTDFPRPASQRYQGALESLTLSRNLTGELELLSRREGVTLFMTLLTAFKILLYRYSGQPDLVVGTHIAGRNRHELEGVIGFFIGTLALRTDLSGNPPFRQLLHRVRETALGAYAHQEVPFEKLVEELQPERSLSHTPFVQVVFNMLNLPSDAIELAGLAIERLPALSAGSKFDLTLYAREQNERLAFKAVYDIDLFAAATITRLLGHFQTLLEGIVADPGCRLSKLPVLTEAEVNAASRSNTIRPMQAFIEFGADAIEQSIPQRFEQQARNCANRLAIKTRTHECSYEELNRVANRVAHALLRSRGSGAERVALLLDHDAPMIAAVLGVLKTGKSYVPLDPTYPRERLAYMLADAQSEVLLASSANLALAKSLNHLQLFNIDALDSPVSNVEVPVSPHAIAYTLYTSGSTGQPKGVTQNHRNVLHFIRAYTNNLHISENDRLTLFSAYGFDAAIQDILAALLNGAALYPMNLKEESLDDLTQWLIENEITLFHSTPSTYRYFVRALRGEVFPALRLIVLGGEAVYKEDVQAYQKHFWPDCLFVNGFGLTESMVNLQYFVGPQTEITRNAVPIGYPVDSTEILLLDKAGDRTELYGEIGIRSAHVALGYLSQPELSKERFLADPSDPARRIYRTGDMARQLADGSLEFAGRKDHQVKLRGYRIELREIEAALAAHPVVCECVAAVKGNNADPQIIAYIVPAEGSTFTRAELAGFLKDKLPDYMIPSTFVALDRLPTTASGKIDYRGLPAPDDSRADAGVAFEAPRTPTEEKLAAIWAEVLKLEKIGIHDNFFDLGGHSLLATQLISRIRDAFQIELPLRALFESPTVAGLSASIVQSQAEAFGEDELAQLLAEAQADGRHIN